VRGREKKGERSKAWDNFWGERVLIEERKEGEGERE
jgi:hypothetical protein